MSADVKVTWEEASLDLSDNYGNEYYAAKIVPSNRSAFLRGLVRIDKKGKDIEAIKTEIPFSAPISLELPKEKVSTLAELNPSNIFYKRAVQVLMAKQNQQIYRMAPDGKGAEKVYQGLRVSQNSREGGYHFWNSFGYIGKDKPPYGNVVISGNHTTGFDLLREIALAFKDGPNGNREHVLDKYFGRMGRRVKTFRVHPLNFQEWKEEAISEFLS